MVDSFNDNNVWLAICEETQSFIYQFDCFICRYNLATLFSHFRDIYNIMEVRTFEYSFSSRNRRAIVNNRELEGLSKIRKTVEITLILCGQFLFAMILAYTLVYLIIPFYDSKDDTYRVVITCAFPLSAVLPKAILRLVLQRISFLHPGRSYILLSTLYNGCTIVFRVMQAELGNQKLFILMSCLHGCVHLLERLTILLRDYLWFFILNKLQRDSCAQEVLSTGAIGFRNPRSIRLVADMSIQIILGESTALVTAVGYIQMYRFMYNGDSPSLSDMHLTEEFFIRVAIG